MSGLMSPMADEISGDSGAIGCNGDDARGFTCSMQGSDTYRSLLIVIQLSLYTIKNVLRSGAIVRLRSLR